MNIGDRIRARREALGYTQEELAKKLGYASRSSVNKVENSRELSNKKVQMFAKILKVSPAYLMGWEDDKNDTKEFKPVSKGVKIPVLGTIAAGIPIVAITDIIDYEEITEETASKGDYYFLKIKGDSMYPQIQNGDRILFRSQPDVESGQIAVVMVNGGDATCKKVMKSEHGITLIAYNQAIYEPVFYNNKQIAEMPITIIGKVVEVRRSL